MLVLSFAPNFVFIDLFHFFFILFKEPLSLRIRKIINNVYAFWVTKHIEVQNAMCGETAILQRKDNQIHGVTWVS